jgi:phenol 2-monooxygenase
MGSQIAWYCDGGRSDRLVQTNGINFASRWLTGIALIVLEFIWGAVDIIPDTDFPDVRKISVIRSNSGSCMIIPRENDMIRLYMQLVDTDVLDSATGQVDRNKMGPEKLLEVSDLCTLKLRDLTIVFIIVYEGG